jgi:hypothetical protein
MRDLLFRMIVPRRILSEIDLRKFKIGYVKILEMFQDRFQDGWLVESL